MTPIVWDRKFEIGHPRIDFEHQIFLDLIRAFSEEVGKVSDPRRINRQLMEIAKYAEFHFISEENIMIDAGYPEFEAHRDLHNALLSELRDMEFRLRVGRTGPEEMSDFLYRWFVQHTSQKDKEIAVFLASQARDGVAPA